MTLQALRSSLYYKSEQALLRLKWFINQLSKINDYGIKMDIQITEKQNTLLISISGSVETAQIKELSQLVESLCESSDRDVEIDLGEAEYMDSTGISLLLKLHKAQKQRGLGFSIVEASERVTSLLSLCSLHEALSNN